MLGEGLRMVVMGVLYPDHYYSPNTFDIFFDWLPMVFLGAVFFSYGIYTFYHNKVKEQEAGFQERKKERKPRPQ
jgi:predicted glycosyltransferase involved in capsule biosynthesis